MPRIREQVPFVSAAPVCVAVAGCVRPCSFVSFLCGRSALVGRLSALECAFRGFPLLFSMLYLCLLLRLFVTRENRAQAVNMYAMYGGTLSASQSVFVEGAAALWL